MVLDDDLVKLINDAVAREVKRALRQAGRTEATPKLGPADDKFGYVFGVDGMMSASDAEDHLGGISRRTLYRLVDAGKIRKGKTNGKVVCCRRSVMNYVQSIEC